MYQFGCLLVDSVGLGVLSVCLSLPKRLPGFEVEEDCVQDVRSQGDGEDGVEEIDLLHDGHVVEMVLLLEKFDLRVYTI